MLAMEKINNICELIGNTPLVMFSNYKRANGLKADIAAKLECFNPAGSAKDRVALAMLNDAEKRGLLKPGCTIIEPTSGNTGIGLAAIGVSRGYRVIIIMPDTMSAERRSLITAYGAEIVLTDGNLGMSGCIAKAVSLLEEIPNSFIPSQFSNPANPRAHFETTGPEIWRDTAGKVDVFVASVGTGGTITGVGKFLKAKNPDIEVVAVEPAESPVLSGGKPGPHKIQGIGAGFVPDVLDTSIYNNVLTVSSEEAYSAVRAVAKTEGVLIGISSGAVISAATKLALLDENQGKLIVAFLVDSAEKYLSTGIFG